MSRLDKLYKGWQKGYEVNPSLTRPNTLRFPATELRQRIFKTEYLSTALPGGKSMANRRRLVKVFGRLPSVLEELCLDYQ